MGPLAFRAQGACTTWRTPCPRAGPVGLLHDAISQYLFVLCGILNSFKRCQINFTTLLNITGLFGNKCWSRLIFSKRLGLFQPWCCSLRLISRLKLICCERKILYHGITVAAHVIGWSFCPMFLLFQVSFTIWFLLLACCLCYVFASWLAGHCQNCTAWLVPIMRTRSILEFLSSDNKLFKGVRLSCLFFWDWDRSVLLVPFDCIYIYDMKLKFCSTV